MKKEILLAIFLGLTVGLLIAFGAYSANKALKEQKIKKIASQPSPSLPPKLSKKNNQLTIDQPENNLVIKEKEATISGQAKPNSTIAILAEDQEKILMANEQGFFSSQIKLIAGVNEITVAAIDKKNQKQEKKIMVVHSTAEIK